MFSPDKMHKGSCSRPNNDGDVTCSLPSLSPKYSACFQSRTPLYAESATDLSTLPSNAPDLLTAPTATTPAFIAISLGFSVVFFILFTFISLRTKLGAKLSAALDRPMVQRTSAWIGLLGFMIGADFRAHHCVPHTNFHGVRSDRFLGHSYVVRKGCRGFQCCNLKTGKRCSATHCEY